MQLLFDKLHCVLLKHFGQNCKFLIFNNTRYSHSTKQRQFHGSTNEQTIFVEISRLLRQTFCFNVIELAHCCKVWVCQKLLCDSRLKGLGIFQQETSCWIGIFNVLIYSIYYYTFTKLIQILLTKHSRWWWGIEYIPNLIHFSRTKVSMHMFGFR